MKITVFGSGAWGTAVALLLCDNGHDVTLWSAHEEKAALLNETRENPLLKGVVIPEGITITSDGADAGKEAELAVLAAPSFACRETAGIMRDVLPESCEIVCISKGIEQGTSLRMSQMLEEVFGPGRKIASLSGPSHAEEVSAKIPTGCVAASKYRDTAMKVQDAFMNDYFRVYTSSDLVGVELGAALKNVIALCAGVCGGLGYGDNTIAMLVTRGLAEMAKLCVALGGRKETLAGLAGLGDLIVTCTSRHSRNRRAGVYIGGGMPARAAMEKVGAVVEGYFAAKAAVQLAEKAGVDMPICREAYHVLYEQKEPRTAIRELMMRSKKSEEGGGESWVTE